MSEPERPERPMLPPLLWALVAAVALERASLALAPEPRALASSAAALALVSGAALAVLALARARRAAARPGAGAAGRPLLSVALVCAASVAAALASAGELARQAELSSRLGSSPVSAWELRVETDMSEGASGWRGRAEVLGGGRALGGVWLLADEPEELGATLRCVGRFSPNADDEWGASSRSQGLVGTVRVVRTLSRADAAGPRGAVLRLRRAVLASLDASSSDARALLAGTVCGSTSAMSRRGLGDVFAACGVSHLVAVSGGHLVLVCALAARLLRRAALPPVARALALLALTGAFVVFCGAPASAVRAWAMSVVSEAAGLLGRRSYPLSSASAAGLAMALADPGVTGQLGFVLSVACVCGICALGPYAGYVVGAVMPAPPRPRGALGRALARARSDAEGALSLTLVSQVVTMPLTCAAFAQLSLVAPLANVVLAPLFSALLSLGLAAACLVWAPPAQAVALACCDAVGSCLMVALRALASLPLACVPVSVEEGPALAALVVLLAVWLAWWPRVSRRAVLASCGALAACGLAWALRWRLLAPARVCVLDVGQGDAILVTDGAASALVDTGPGDAVAEALARAHVTHLDAVVLTHLHADHAGGLEAVLGAVGVGGVVVPEGAAAPECARDLPVAEVGHGDALRVGRFELRVVSPLEPAGGEGNEGSLVLLLTFDDGDRSLTALLAADAEREETGAAIERGEVGDVDLLKVGHHGSAASVTPEIAAALDPEVSVASAGEGNRYGHPDPACVAALEGVGSTFLCTIEAGDVTVEPGAEGPRVSCRRGPPR